MFNQLYLITTYSESGEFDDVITKDEHLKLIE